MSARLAGVPDDAEYLRLDVVDLPSLPADIADYDNDDWKRLGDVVIMESEQLSPGS